MEYPIVKLRQLLESDASARQALRILSQSLWDIKAWNKAITENLRMGKVLRVYPNSEIPASASFYVMSASTGEPGYSFPHLSVVQYYRGDDAIRGHPISHMLRVGIIRMEAEKIPTDIRTIMNRHRSYL